MSISWKLAARAGATALAAVVTLALLPSLLHAPEPPPLDPELGLLPVERAQVGGVPAGQVDRGRDEVEPPHERDRTERGGREAATGGSSGGERLDRRDGGGRPGHPAEEPEQKEEPQKVEPEEELQEAPAAPAAPAPAPVPVLAPAPPEPYDPAGEEFGP